MREIYGKLICETLDEVLHPDRCALLLVDIQNDAMLPEGKIAAAGNDIGGMQEILPRCAALLEQARALDVKVVHVTTVTLAEGRSDSPSWLRTKGTIVTESEFFLEGTWGAEVCEEVKPGAGEPVIVKHRSSGFRATNLDLVLRSMDVETVVVVGEQTPGCIEATFRDAAYHDYYNVLVEDCVAAFDPELHEASLKIQRARHDVCTAAEVVETWTRARGG